MPNWCSNTIVVSGDDLTKFREFLDNGRSFLSKINPTPQPLVDTVSGWSGNPEEQKKIEEKQAANLLQYGAKDWYDWNIHNWGTKWDVDAEFDDASSTDTEIILSFESAWAPPQVAISSLAEKFPELSIRHSYFEEGMCFVGVDEYSNGVIANEIYNEDSSSDEWKQLAHDEFGWEPWPDDVDEMTENEAGQVTEVPKPAKKKVKKAASKKKPTKKVAKKKKAKKK
jgi:hypothetical protein